jgi:hypothetical protein
MSFFARSVPPMKLTSEMVFRLWSVIGLAMVVGAVACPADGVDFNRDVRPILSANCFTCHGPDADAREADLRLDTSDGAAAVVRRGNLDSSSLIFRIETDDGDQLMPPPDSGHRLSEAEKQMLRSWVTAGAEYETHWSFIRPRREPETARGTLNPIDKFVVTRLDEAGLAPNPPANRYQLIRRATLDLIGLPPTPEEVDAFVADRSENAFEKIVDRLLASESFGEHWTRMWLDLARYADTKGYEKDNPREIWRYRDWVIRAFNQDMPYDEFTTEQLAGDLLPGATIEQRLATAMHRNTLTNEEGGTDDEEFRVAAVKDRVDTTIQVWMGVTMGCAKCHSHKYDPVSQEEYYRFFALFNQTADNDREAPMMSSPTTEQLAEAEKLQRKIASLGQHIDSFSDEFDQAYKQWLDEIPNSEVKGEGRTREDFQRVFPSTRELAEQLDAAKKELAELRGRFAKTPVMQELPADKARQTRIHRRGNFLDPGDVVQPDVPAAFGTLPENAPTNRLGVAQWIMSPENPLTARVMVNRIWARLFGVGIVETEEDFGTQGLEPTHPELLDWLAIEYQQQGWSLKRLLKTILMSGTYQQSSVISDRKLVEDPRNRLLSRGARFRMSAEMIRDQALAAAGLMTFKVGGPSVMPPQPSGVWKSTYSVQKWINADGEDRYRRGLYTYWKRTSPFPAMTTFDAGSGEVCLVRRVRTNTPLQALITLNDPSFVEAAGGLATRMRQNGLSYGFRLLLSRPPSDRELERLQSLFDSAQREFAADLAAAANLAESAGLNRITADADLAAWITVANVLLNLDETLTKT